MTCPKLVTITNQEKTIEKYVQFKQNFNETIYPKDMTIKTVYFSNDNYVWYDDDDYKTTNGRLAFGVILKNQPNISPVWDDILLSLVSKFGNLEIFEIIFIADFDIYDGNFSNEEITEQLNEKTLKYYIKYVNGEEQIYTKDIFIEHSLFIFAEIEEKNAIYINLENSILEIKKSAINETLIINNVNIEYYFCILSSMVADAMGFDKVRESDFINFKNNKKVLKIDKTSKDNIYRATLYEAVTKIDNTINIHSNICSKLKEFPFIHDSKNNNILLCIKSTKGKDEQIVQNEKNITYKFKEGTSLNEIDFYLSNFEFKKYRQIVKPKISIDILMNVYE
jgi:hypothetical protein